MEKLSKEEIISQVIDWERKKEFLAKYAQKIAKRKTGHLRPTQVICDELHEAQVKAKAEKFGPEKSRLYNKISKLKAELKLWEL